MNAIKPAQPTQQAHDNANLEMDFDMDLEMEALMIEALDGTLSPADQARLNAYWAAHPEARAQFDQLAQFDQAFESAGQMPKRMVPAQLTNNVMAQIQTLPAFASQPARQPARSMALSSSGPGVITDLSGKQIALIILMCSAAMAVALGLGGGALAFGSSFWQPAGALLREISIVARDVFNIVVALLRGIFMLPLTWVVLAVGGVAITMWMRLVAGAWLPKPQLA